MSVDVVFLAIGTAFAIAAWGEQANARQHETQRIPAGFLSGCGAVVTLGIAVVVAVVSRLA